MPKMDGLDTWVGGRRGRGRSCPQTPVDFSSDTNIQKSFQRKGILPSFCNIYIERHFGFFKAGEIEVIQ